MSDPTFVITVAVLCGIAGWGIGNRKGHPIWGLALGLFLSFIGIIIIVLVPTTEEKRIRNAETRLRIENEARRRTGQDPPVR